MTFDETLAEMQEKEKSLKNQLTEINRELNRIQKEKQQAMQRYSKEVFENEYAELIENFELLEKHDREHNLYKDEFESKIIELRQTVCNCCKSKQECNSKFSEYDVMRECKLWFVYLSDTTTIDELFRTKR